MDKQTKYSKDIIFSQSYLNIQCSFSHNLNKNLKIFLAIFLPYKIISEEDAYNTLKTNIKTKLNFETIKNIIFMLMQKGQIYSMTM